MLTPFLTKLETKQTKVGIIGCGNISGLYLAAGKGFLFSDQGDIALRGFEDPLRLYEVRWEG